MIDSFCHIITGEVTSKHFSDVKRYNSLLTVPMTIYIGVSLLYCLIASAFVAFTVSYDNINAQIYRVVMKF